MNSRALGFTALVVVTAGLVYVAMDSYQSRTADVAAADSSLFLPTLKAALNDTARIRAITPAGPVTFERDEERWVVREKSNYEANAQRVNRLLLGLAHLKRIEAKTSKVERYGKIGLREPGKDGSNANRYTVEDASGTVTTDIIIGDRKPARANPNANEFYVRVPGNPQAWLVEGSLPVSADVTDWLIEALFDLDVDRVKRVLVTHSDGERLDVLHSPGVHDGYTLKGIPEGREVDNQLLVRNVATGVMQFVLDDVEPASAHPKPAKLDVALDITTYDGLTVNIAGSRIDEDYLYVWMSAAYQPEGAQHSAPEGEVEGEGDDKIVRLDETAVRAEVERLNTAWAPWRFEIGRWRIATADKRVSDFLKELPKPVAPAASGG
jgi:hypothetical protein